MTRARSRRRSRCNAHDLPALADTLPGALTQAYQNNPQLNSQRASVRATDENVPQALSGYRPRVSLTASAGEQYLVHRTNRQLTQPGASPSSTSAATSACRSAEPSPRSCSTASKPRAAPGWPSLVSAARETLRLTEQTVLLNAATAYMNVIRDAAMLELAAQQRRGAAGTASPDPRPLRGRRGHPHRRGAIGIAPGRGARLDADRGIQLHDVAFGLSAGHRRAAGSACAGSAGRPAFAAEPRRRRRRGTGAASVGHHREVQRRCGGAAGQDRGGRALSDAERWSATSRRITARQRADGRWRASPPR